MGRRDEVLDLLTLALIDLMRDPELRGKLLPSQKDILERAGAYGRIAGSQSGLPDGIWTDLAKRFRVVLVPRNYKAEVLERELDIREIHVAATPDAIADEAAHLHISHVDADDTCFYSCGLTLANMVRRAASSMKYGKDFTACSSVVLATDTPSSLPPSAILADFQRTGVNTLSFLLPRAVQECLDVDANPDARRAVRDAIERTAFGRLSEASFLWLGIGTISQPGSFSEHCRSLDAVRELEERCRAVGEVGFMPVADNGRLVYDNLGLARSAPGSNDNWREVSGKPLGKFFNSTYVLKLPNLPPDVEVAVVAGGPKKVTAIWHGLRFLQSDRQHGGTGGIAHFVTDAATLDALYDLIPRERRPISDHPQIASAFELPPDVLAQLMELARRQQCDVATVIRKALDALATT